MNMFTQQQKDYIINEMGDIIGRFYILWYNDNGLRIITEWLEANGLTYEDVDANQMEITKKVHDEWSKWCEENL